MKDADINLYLAKALLGEGKYQAAYDRVSGFISEGHSSEEIK
jgi:hypothetical protein